MAVLSKAMPSADDAPIDGVKVKQVQGVGGLVAGNGQLVQPGSVILASQLHRVGDVDFRPSCGR